MKTNEPNDDSIEASIINIYTRERALFSLKKVVKKATLRIVVAIPILWGWSLCTNAAQPCTEEPDKEPEKTKLLSISNEWQGKKLDVVKTKADSLKFIDRWVQLVGKYVVKIWNPGIDSNTVKFQSTYKQASIELADGTLIPLIQPYNKLSLRSTAEVQAYAGKLVEVVGYIQLQPNAPISENSSQSVMLTSLDGIRLKE
jgi:hypothetical protein